MSNYILLTLSFLLSINTVLSADKIVLWTSNENVQKAVRSVAPAFEKEYGATVEAVVLNKDLTTKFKTAALSGKGPDIVAWAHDVVGELASSGLLAPVEIGAKEKKNFFKVTIDAFTYQGKLYGYPYDLEAIALIYNKKLVKTAPKTMDELFNVAKGVKTKHPKKYGFLYDIGNLFFSFPMLSAQGGYVFKSRAGVLNVKDVGLANTGAIAGGDLISKVVTSGIVPASTDRSIAFTKMKKGELGITIDGPWSRLDLQKSGIDFGVAALPTFKGKVMRPFVGVHGFMIRRSSKQKDLAREFIENYLVSKSGIVQLYKADPRAPSRSDSLEELKSDRVLMEFVKSAKNGIPMPNVPQMGVVWSAMKGALSSITEGKQTAKSALTVAKSQIDEAISKK